MGETFKRRVGFLPVWAWALLLVIVLALYLSYRNKKKAAAAAAAQAQQTQNNLSSNLGTVPVSNLTTAAQPMPIQMGDTFVSTSVPTTITNSPTQTVTNKPPPSTTSQPAPPPAPSPVVNSTAGKAYGIVNTVQGLMYWLGVNTTGSKVYKVGGGAPVYFGNASGLAQGGQYEHPGQDIYTPVGYGNQIASTPVALQSAYGS